MHQARRSAREAELRVRRLAEQLNFLRDLEDRFA